MKNPTLTLSPGMTHRCARGFTLMETVIAIGVLAVLLTGFIAVFTPAAQGIRRSISAQQADRLTTTLERELVTLRKDQEDSSITTGFAKAFNWILEGNDPADAIFVYQYRGDPKVAPRTDGSLQPTNRTDGQPGQDYVIQSMARRASETTELTKDLDAIVGSVFYVKPIQLVYDKNAMVLNNEDFKSGSFMPIAHTDDTGNLAKATDAATYNDAVIAFSAEFYSVPTKSATYLTGPDFDTRFNDSTRPVFTRNLAVRR